MADGIEQFILTVNDHNRSFVIGHLLKVVGQEILQGLGFAVSSACQNPLMLKPGFRIKLDRNLLFKIVQKRGVFEILLGEILAIVVGGAGSDQDDYSFPGYRGYLTVHAYCAPTVLLTP